MLGAIHEFSIKRNTTASVTSEGRASTTFSLVPVVGHIAISPEELPGGTGAEQTTAGKKAEVALLVARVPETTTVSSKDQIVVTDVLGFNGTYQIERIQKTARHFRLFLRDLQD